MFVIPAIDLKAGRCVRLVQGDPQRETVYNDDPVAQAREFAKAGADLIHVVDLDGAFTGNTPNFSVIEKIAAEGISVEVGGGIRSREAIEKYLAIGVRHIITGTIMLDEGFALLAREFGGHITGGVDARDGKVATHGWKSTTRVDVIEFIRRIHGLGIHRFICTDIATDGMLAGPNIESLKKILEAVEGISIVASGGISSVEDIRALRKIDRIEGCITGKAVYDGRINLEEALSI